MHFKKSIAILLLLTFLFACSIAGCAPKKDTDIFEVKAVTWALGVSLPTAEEFILHAPEGAQISFADDNPYSSLNEGENQIRISCKPEKGKAVVKTATLTLVSDKTGPSIAGVRDLIVYVGEGVSYRSGITLNDNCGGLLHLDVDSTAVNTAQEGVYPVVYTASDLAGNVTTVKVNVHVYSQKITEEMLYAMIDPIIAELGLVNMTKEAQVRTIYRFVHTDARIAYVDTSDKASWVRAAYFALEDREGDCFSYFSVSKAFFARLGIENLDVQRLEGFTDDTHYWSMVNVGTTSDPIWYHYDSTRLRDIPYEGSLLTDAQIESFHRIRPYFYLYDRTQYPASATTVITPRPDL